MKKLNLVLAFVLAGIVAASATQNETISRAEVRNPYELTTILNDNASDAEDRMTTLEADDMSDGGTVQGEVTAISTNGVTTNVIITVDGVLEGGSIGGTTLTVAQGGSGAATFTTGGGLYGTGTSAFTALAAAANGEIPIGDGSGAPQLGTITATAGETEVSNGAGSITIGLPGVVSGVTTISNATLIVDCATLDVSGATKLGGGLALTNTYSITMDGTTCVTSNQAFLSATGVTNTMVIVDGLIKAIN